MQQRTFLESQSVWGDFLMHSNWWLFTWWWCLVLTIFHRFTGMYVFVVFLLLFLLFFACCQVCVRRANELKAMWVVICQTGPISKSNISTIIAGQFGCFWQIVNLLNCSAFKKAQGTKTQVGWDWEEILLGGSVKTQNIHSRHKIFS